MKIAYLILAHKNPPQLTKLISTLNNSESDIYIHIDKKHSLYEYKKNISIAKNIHFIKRRVNIKWGGFSMIKATLNLLKLATQAHHDYYILLSGQDYPIKSYQELKNKLSESQFQYIDFYKMPAPEINIKMYRLEYFFIPTKNRHSKSGTIINNFLMKLGERNWKKAFGNAYPHAGFQWWCLSHNCVQYILEYIKSHRKLVNYFRFVKIPDEMFFQTILSDSPFRNHIQPSLMFADWKRGNPVPPLPAIIDESYLKSLSESDKYFARKFDLAKYPDIFKKIDAHLLNSDSLE